ncbi:hypothetical protein FHL15_004499 [Xylaria flabelliformis]|uniref:Uncharacterized protein n=1 Tax=Xylaria flabelliformis TaxID=2512241 RepID=A0A553I3E7_9PEZI|nr:hypothetical protein FHL15_004499 [Xylaria flabelliformis]
MLLRATRALDKDHDTMCWLRVTSWRIQHTLKDEGKHQKGLRPVNMIMCIDTTALNKAYSPEQLGNIGSLRLRLLRASRVRSETHLQRYLEHMVNDKLTRIDKRPSATFTHESK